MTTATKERPIIFSGEMVCAILEGRKTQTRRPVKPQPVITNVGGVQRYGLNVRLPAAVYSDIPVGPQPFALAGIHAAVLNQHGAVSVETPQGLLGVKPGEFQFLCPYGQPGYRFRLRGLPRWASRILLEIVSVRVERIQEITHDDAIAEGVDAYIESLKDKTAELREQSLSLKQLAFSYLWDSAYPGSWDRNDWVWVIEFRRINEAGKEKGE